MNSFVEALAKADILCAQDLVDVPPSAFEKVWPDSPGKRGLATRAVKAAEHEFAVSAASSSSGGEKPALAQELLTLLKKEPTKVAVCCKGLLK